MVRGTQRANHILRDLIWGVALHEKPGHSIHNDVRYRPDRRCEYRRPAGHGLEHDVWEPFGVGGEDEELELVEVFREVVVGDPAREVDAAGNPPFLKGGLDRLSQRPISADECTELRPIVEDGGKGLGKMLNALLIAQPADIADEGRAGGKRRGDGECVEVEEVLVGDEDFVAIRFEVPLGDEGGGIEDEIVCQSISYVG